MVVFGTILHRGSVIVFWSVRMLDWNWWNLSSALGIYAHGRTCKYFISNQLDMAFP